MPSITIQMIARSEEIKRQLAAEITAVTARICNVPLENVGIYFKEMQADEYAKAGVMRIDETK